MGHSTSTSTDNLYKEGSFIIAKADPGIKLKIMRYYQRIYYCARVDNPDLKQLVYFERELIPPVIE